MFAPSFVQAIAIRDSEGSTMAEVSRYGSNPDAIRITTHRLQQESASFTLSTEEAEALSWAISALQGGFEVVF